MRAQFLIIVLLFLGMTVPFVALAQTVNETMLPPEAQAAVKKGIMAAKEQDYVLATRYFQDARKVAPDAPEVFFDLGLAESKIPGRELRAMAWFGAYLAATPNAPNAMAVKDQIDLLNVKSQSDLSHLIQSAQEAAGQIPSDNFRELDLATAAGLWAETGDMTSAMKIVDSMPEHYKVYAQEAVAEGQAKAGDIAGAQATVGQISLTDFKHGPLCEIAKAQVKVGDMVGALKTAALIQDSNNGHSYEYDAYGAIFDAQLAANDIAGAKKTVDLMPSMLLKAASIRSIAQAQIKAGDLAGAQKTVDSIQVGDDNSDYYKCDAQATIAKAQAAAGDTAGAKDTIEEAIKTAGLIAEHSNSKVYAQEAIAEAQAAAGDIAGAQKTADLINNSSTKDNTLPDIIEAQARAGDMAGALKTAELLKDSQNAYARTMALPSIAKGQAEAGNSEAALKTADSIQDLTSKSYAFNGIINAQVKAGDMVGAEKTLGLIQDKDLMWKNAAQKVIADAQAKGGSKNNPNSKSDWFEKLDNNNINADCALSSGPFMDLGSYLTAQHSDDPPTLVNTLENTAEKIITAQSIINQMLKQDTKP